MEIREKEEKKKNQKRKRCVNHPFSIKEEEILPAPELPLYRTCTSFTIVYGWSFSAELGYR